jgi:hypothetical protein
MVPHSEQSIQGMNQTVASKTGQPQAEWRLRLGLVILVVGFLSPLSIPLVTATELPVRWKAVISGALAVGIPEVFSIVAIAIMGKAGFNYIKARIFGFLKKHGPPDRVSLTRYRIGLVMFMLPVVFGWLGPYGAHLIPGYETHRLFVSLIGDLMFFASFFVLGGDFWDKVRALFIWDASVDWPKCESN